MLRVKNLYKNLQKMYLFLKKKSTFYENFYFPIWMYENVVHDTDVFLSELLQAMETYT